MFARLALEVRAEDFGITEVRFTHARRMTMYFSKLIDNLRQMLRSNRPSRPQSARPQFSVEELEARTVLSVLPPAPTGLAVVIRNEDPHSNPLAHSAFKQEVDLISNPNISGVAFQIDWKNIEPTKPNGPSPLEPDWSRLDEVFQAADKAGKWVQLLIFPGFWSPSWVTAHDSGVVTHVFKVQYGYQNDHEPMKLPMPWDKVYLQEWTDFLKLVGQRYGNDPAFRMIAAAGPTSVSDEFTEPDHKNVDRWTGYQYSLRKYDDAWHQVFEAYANDFKQQYVSLSHGTGIALTDHEIEAIVNHGSRVLNPRFAYQSSALTGNPEHHETAIQSVLDRIGQFVTGFQLGHSVEGTSPGDPAHALVRAIDNGLQLNAAGAQGGQHVDYIEVHAEDVAAPDLQPVLAWAASLFPQERGLRVI
jgi:hypothetical protein